MTNGPISTFIKHHYRHFNAAAMVDASEAYRKHVEGGGHMLLAMAGQRAKAPFFHANFSPTGQPHSKMPAITR